MIKKNEDSGKKNYYDGKFCCTSCIFQFTCLKLIACGTVMNSCYLYLYSFILVTEATTERLRKSLLSEEDQQYEPQSTYRSVLIWGSFAIKTLRKITF